MYTEQLHINSSVRRLVLTLK